MGYEESSRICAQSLFVRSKPSPLPTWYQKWKRDSWTQHLYGRILRPSLGHRFTEEWTSSLAVIHASPSVQQESGQERKTLATCGHGLQMELLSCSPESASSRTSTGTFRWDSPQSSAIWKSLVTKRRGEYSVRLNAARVMNGKEFSFLPTPCANEDSFRLQGSSQQSKTLEAKARRGELKTVGSAKCVERMSFVAASATTENLSVLDAENGPIHSSTNQMMDARNADHHSPGGQTILAGPLNPAFVEVMMGLPIGWTDCASSETE